MNKYVFSNRICAGLVSIAMLFLGIPCAAIADYAYGVDKVVCEAEIKEDVTQRIELLNGELASAFFQESLDMAVNLNIDKVELSNAYLGDPFYIYGVDEPDKVDIYYYPVLNDDESVLYVLAMWKTSDGWTYDLSTEYVDMLKDVGYPKNQCVFYEDDGNIAAENDEGMRLIQSKNEDALIAYSEKPASEKLDNIVSALVYVNEFNLEDTDVANPEYFLDSYSPSLTSDDYQTYCDLYKRKGQGNTYTALCWAATVATIVNYRKGENNTATEVASRMGIRYNQGGDITDAEAALQKYGCTAYDYILYDQLEWAEIKKNINKKKPIYMSSKDGNAGHATVLYGYGINGEDVKFLTMWNPGLNKGAGVEHIIRYKKGSVTYEYGNYTMRWCRSLYAVKS